MSGREGMKWMKWDLWRASVSGLGCGAPVSVKVSCECQAFPEPAPLPAFFVRLQDYTLHKTNPKFMIKKWQETFRDLLIFNNWCLCCVTECMFPGGEKRAMAVCVKKMFWRMGSPPCKNTCLLAYTVLSPFSPNKTSQLVWVTGTSDRRRLEARKVGCYFIWLKFFP